MCSKFLECDPSWCLTRLQSEDWTSEGDGTAEDTRVVKASAKHSVISPDQTVETDFSLGQYLFRFAHVLSKFSKALVSNSWVFVYVSVFTYLFSNETHCVSQRW